MSRIYPVVLLLGLVLMVAGAATTYVALGQDGETEAVTESLTEEIQPTPTLEPTVEPPVVEAPPVQPIVEQPAQPVVDASPVQPTVEVIVPTPTEVILPTEVIPPTVVENAVVVVEQTEVVMPTEVIPPTVVENAAPVAEVVLPTEAQIVPEQTEAVIPTEVLPPTVENIVSAAGAAAPEQTEVVAPTEAVIVPEQTDVVMPTEVLPAAEQTEIVAPTEAVVPTQTVDLAAMPTLPGLSSGQSNEGEVPTVGPENPLEITPSVVPTSEVPDMAATAESTLELTVDPLVSVTPVDGIATEIPAEATEAAVTTSTLIRGSASSAFGQIQGITLTLIQPDGTTLEAITDEQGGFAFEGLLAGDYTLSATTPGALSSQAVFTLTEGQQLELPPTVLAIGDLNHDNQIDMNDVVLLAANYNYPAEDTGIDLNGDAWIDISDLAIIGAQFGAVGPLPWM